MPRKRKRPAAPPLEGPASCELIVVTADWLREHPPGPDTCVDEFEIDGKKFFVVGLPEGDVTAEVELDGESYTLERRTLEGQGGKNAGVIRWAWRGSLEDVARGLLKNVVVPILVEKLVAEQAEKKEKI